MRWFNDNQSYGFVARTLHWGTALLILGSYGSVYFRRFFTEANTEFNWAVLQLHLSLGLTILTVTVLRIIWYVVDQRPTPEANSKSAVWGSRVGHTLLYVILFSMPVTGYLGTGANTDFFWLFEIPKFESTHLFTFWVSDRLNMTFAEFEVVVDYLHKDVGGALLVWMLIAGHISAALVHHFVLKDRSLRRMLGI